MSIFVCVSCIPRAPCFAKDFVLAGNSEDNLYGTCESFYKPNLGSNLQINVIEKMCVIASVVVIVAAEPDDLFEVLAQCLLAGVDRDAKSGWGGVVHIMYVSAHTFFRT